MAAAAAAAVPVAKEAGSRSYDAKEGDAIELAVPAAAAARFLKDSGCFRLGYLPSTEECGDVTSDGVVSLLDCHALEDILLRHNGSGIQKDFIGNAVTKLPMLRKMSLDICDAKDRDFDIPEWDDRHFLSHVKIARCKSQRCNFSLQHVRASRSPVHTETLVLVWDSKQLTRTIINERV
ncbi:hypothetical protein L6452_26188 [Arctium lappa]|uniref:Uncharacterized protein n=1 Tax=Arctium lappa TaxID=4217 RepID=A0ACB9ACH5_ARCLA|nr:hypothetical protein L6452_26188 [Arctium lappa]